MIPRFHLIAALLALALPSCGLVRAPFRIVGNVAGGTYRAGTDLVDSTRTAMDERRQRKEAEEKRAKAKAEKDAATKPRPQPSPTEIPIPSDLPAPADSLPIEPITPDYLPPLPP